jgi:hypothetical protein
MNSITPNPALQPTVLAFGVALPSQRCAQLGAAELDRWAAEKRDAR